MKTLILSIALVFVASVGFAQSHPATSDYVFVPRTLSAGTSISGRTISSSHDDTTQAIALGGWTRGFVSLQFSANDSGNIIIAYQTSTDGVNWYTTFTTIDSAKSTGTTTYNKIVELPAGAMGAQAIRLRFYASTAGVPFSANPSTAITAKVRLKRQ